MKYLSDCSLSDIIEQIKSGDLSVEALIDQLCNKLEAWEPFVQAFLPEDNRRIRLKKDLENLYRRFPNPEKRPIFFGIPIGVKDIFNVDGFQTKGGSNLPSAELSGKEADSVTKLKEAGALVMGKTVTTEFAYFDPGPTANPHNIEHTPGGSSSGSAAAVASGFCPLALGTQTIGSITRPAAFCGVYGFKPTYNRISISGVIPFSKSVDHLGFFTQDILGLKTVASLLVNNWENLDPINKIKPTFGIPVGAYLDQADPMIIKSFYSYTDRLRELDYQIETFQLFANIEEINNCHKLINAYEFSRVHEKWFSIYKDKYHQASRDLIEKGLKISDAKFDEALKFKNKIKKECIDLQNENNIDIWISPSAPTLAPKGLSSTGNPIMNLPWTFIGLPTISVPHVLINDLPTGIQFAGSFSKDEILFNQVESVIKKCAKYRKERIQL